MVFACVARVDPPMRSVGMSDFYLRTVSSRGRQSVSHSVAQSPRFIGDENKSCHLRKTTNSSSHTPIWPFVNQCVGSGSRWSEIAE